MGKVDADSRSALTPDDWDKLKQAVLQVRFPILLDLLHLGTTWHTAVVGIAELPQFRVMNFPPHAKLAPGRTFGEFTKRLDEGRDPVDDPAFGQNYRKMRPILDPVRMRGTPIVVCPSLDGPFTGLEGYTRMSVLISRNAAGESVPREIPILIGECSRLPEWHLWGVAGGHPVRTSLCLA
jgi:hypothetical protein